MKRLPNPTDRSTVAYFHHSDEFNRDAAAAVADDHEVLSGDTTEMTHLLQLIRFEGFINDV